MPAVYKAELWTQGGCELRQRPWLRGFVTWYTEQLQDRVKLYKDAEEEGKFPSR